MRWSSIIILSALLVGCATSQKHDARLNGTWRSNREESVAAAFQKDPRWTNAPPDKVARFKDMFGHMTVAYSKDEIHISDRGKQWTTHYQIVEKGKDYVIVQTHGGGFADGLQMRIRFVDGGNGYWIDSGNLLGNDTPEEKFDRVPEPQHGADPRHPVKSP